MGENCIMSIHICQSNKKRRMNIKIKASGVACLVGDDYDRVYAALKKQFGDGVQTLFTERKPGHEYLQWVLPDDGWKPITESDPLISNEIERELQRRKAVVYERFGSNQAMAQRILSVPDNSFVYYKASPQGSLDIKLTAWGYKYPERIGGTQVVGNIDNTKMRELSLKFENDGKGIPNMPFRLNGFNRTTDENGEYPIGDLPVGYQFDVEYEGVHQHFTVKESDGIYVFDCTKYGTVGIKVTLDGVPETNVEAEMTYNGKSHRLLTDDAGTATFQVAIADNQACKVRVKGEHQEKNFEEGENITFEFSFSTPEPEPEPEPEPKPEPELEPEPEPELHPDEKQEEAPKKEDIQKPAPPIVEVYVYKDNDPIVSAEVKVHCGDINANLFTDNAGRACIDLQADKIGAICQVEAMGTQQEAQLKSGINSFRFDIKSEPPHITKAVIEVVVNRDGAPWQEENVRISYGSNDIQLKTNEQGLATAKVDIVDDKELCRVSVEDEYQAVPLKEGKNRFFFEFKSEKIADNDKPSLWTYIKGVLSILLILALVWITYTFCGGMLFS